MACTKPMTSAQNTKAFIEKIVSNTNIAQSYNQKSNILNVSKKKFSLDHSNAPKENFSNKNLNYFISPRSSSEQIFKNIKNMASSSKNDTFLSSKPVLNISNSINKDISQDKENTFLKYLKENHNFGKNKLWFSTEKNDDQKKEKNTAEIIESLESLKNKYKTLKEMNFLKCNKTGESSEMICASKFSKITNNNNFNRLRNNGKENNGIQNNENSTNNTMNENSKKSNGIKKNISGNMSNILSTNSNSDGEIHQISNEKDQKTNKNPEKTLFTEIFNKNLSLYPLNKEKIMKVFQNLAKKHNGNPKNPTVFSRNLSIPENNTQIFDGKKQIERRNSLHCEPKNDQTIIPDKFIGILKKTKKIMDSYKMKEIKWKKEKNVLHSQIDELKKRLSLYEVI